MSTRDEVTAKLAVLGATGRLGGALVGKIRRRGAAVVAAGRAELDLERLASIGPYLERLEPTAVINATAYNDVDGAERPAGRETAFLVNRDAPRQLAVVCRRLGIPLVHVSTDYVFDGRARRPYREDDEPAPLQTYGLSKLQGERAVLETHPGALVARTSTLFGPGPRPDYVEAVLRQARAGSAFDVVEHPVASPTYAPDLAAALLGLLSAGATGLFHAVNGGRASRLELAQEAVAAAGLASRVTVGVRPASTTGASRPRFSVLDGSRLAEALGTPLRPWREALREYVGRLGA